jgi:hypothetical protein
MAIVVGVRRPTGWNALAGLARRSRQETRFGLQGGIRGRGFKVVLREEREPTVTWTSHGLRDQPTGEN